MQEHRKSRKARGERQWYSSTPQFISPCTRWLMSLGVSREPTVTINSWMMVTNPHDETMDRIHRSSFWLPRLTNWHWWFLNETNYSILLLSLRWILLTFCSCFVLLAVGTFPAFSRNVCEFRLARFARPYSSSITWAMHEIPKYNLCTEYHKQKYAEWKRQHKLNGFLRRNTLWAYKHKSCFASEFIFFHLLQTNYYDSIIALHLK